MDLWCERKRLTVRRMMTGASCEMDGRERGGWEGEGRGREGEGEEV